MTRHRFILLLLLCRSKDPVSHRGAGSVAWLPSVAKQEEQRKTIVLKSLSQGNLLFSGGCKRTSLLRSTSVLLKKRLCATWRETEISFSTLGLVLLQVGPLISLHSYSSEESLCQLKRSACIRSVLLSLEMFPPRWNHTVLALIRPI